MEKFYSEEVYNKIEEFITEAGNILLLSHLDGDGLSSAGLMSRLLKSYDKTFTTRVLKQLEDDEEFKHEHDLIIITDMGSGQLNLVKPYLNSKKFIIIDHHQKQGSLEHPNLVHFNPGLNNDTYSGSSLTYLVITELNSELNNLLHLALVGANGDRQNRNGFKGLNKELMHYGVSNDYLDVIKGLNVFGRVSRPLHEALAYSFELEIPGVSGNESASIEFLSELNIDLKFNNGDWKTLSTMNGSEKKKLISNIIIKRLSDDLSSEIISPIVVVKNSNELLTDLKEWSVLLNACGRQNKAGLGVLLCMGYKDYALPLVEEVVKDYKILLAKTINKVKKEGLTHAGDDLLVIKGGGEVKDTVIGTVGGILLNSGEFEADTFIGFANREDGDSVKVSCRTSNEIVNLGELIKAACAEFEDCEGGGHKLAGGAVIKNGFEDDFLNVFKEKLGETLIK